MEPQLLERDREQQQLTEALDSALRGEGRFVMVKGPAGVGKSRLLDTARRSAERAECRVLAARATDLEQGHAFGVVRQLFEPVLARFGGVDHEMLAGPARQALAVVDPNSPEASLPMGDFTVLHGLYWLLVSLCDEGTVVLVVDDMQWADEASLRSLAYLLPRLEGLSLLVVAGTRPVDSGAQQRLLDHIEADEAVSTMRLTALSPQASAKLAGEELGPDADEAFRSAFHQLTGGNPLLVRELARAVAAEGLRPVGSQTERLSALSSRAVGRRVAVRLSSVGPEGQSFARAAALLGEGAELREVSAVAGISTSRAMDLLGRLATIDVLRPQTPLEFVHPLILAAVYEDMEPADRLCGHARAATLLSESGASTERVATQLLRTLPTGEPWVAEVLHKAAREASAKAAPESALAYYGRRLQEPFTSKEEEVDILMAAGTAAQLIDQDRAVVHLGRALQLAEDSEQRAAIVSRLGASLFMLSRQRDSVALYQQAITELDENHSDMRRRLQASLISVTAGTPELNSVADRMCAELKDQTEADDLGSRMLGSLITWHDAIAGTIDAATATRGALHALGDGQLIEHVNESEMVPDAVWVLVAADREEVLAVCEASQKRAQRDGSIAGVGVSMVFRSLAWLRRGALPEAEAVARQTMRIIEATRIDVVRPFVAAFLAETLMEQGRLSEAEAALEWADHAGRLPKTGQLYWLQAGRARLAILQGRYHEGWEAMRRCGSMSAAHGWNNPAFLPWRSEGAVALHALGRPEEALTLVREELLLAQQWGAPKTLAQALRATAPLVAEEEGISLLRRAASCVKSSPARLEYAKTLLELGTLLSRTGERAEARGHLRTALDLADACAAAPLADRARAELRAAGAQPRRSALTGVEALTPSEERIAHLVVANQTNRAIAQKLFITPKTVEVHLTSIYRKLDVTNRHDVASALDPHAPPG
ncbi:AAA family ATPase [Streptomyces sp. RKAG290]|uniref:helix-turn-helix transcriptional regulator n=1 Tax=Streptomyces sp. RKAG290 TaxID=2888348 RepID=UPI002034055B|nr:AAA family ATPase [Streptomyces sp. RKAG290]MCM2410820.1 AAA family ATPase [Streptomyces sp. RKAG290]